MVEMVVFTLKDKSKFTSLSDTETCKICKYTVRYYYVVGRAGGLSFL